MKALTLFSKILNGWYLRRDVRNSITKMDYKIIKRLIKQRIDPHRYKSKFPKYIDECFNRYCDNMSVAKLNIAALDHHYGGLFSEFVTKANGVKLLSYDKVNKLFENAWTIKSYDNGSVDENHLEHVLEFLTSINDANNKLRRITITGDNIDDNMLLRLQVKDKYMPLFKAIGWIFILQIISEING